jgi:CheY-like chemotaxis protein
LLNLVVNARDAMPVGGRLSIETENVVLDREQLAADPEMEPGPYVCITIADTGAGMTPDVQERAFEPFFTTKGIGKGTGLGLSQVYGFVKQLQGRVELTSEPQVGTMVRLYLPSSRDAASAADETAATPLPRARAAVAETILVVEDDPDVRMLLDDSLRALGYRVLTADDGVSALAMIKAGEPVDLLFTDIAMPNGLRGDELARQAVGFRPEIKVLLTSGYAAALADRQTAEEFPVLPKPHRREELARTIRDVLDR